MVEVGEANADHLLREGPPFIADRRQQRRVAVARISKFFAWFDVVVAGSDGLVINKATLGAGQKRPVDRSDCSSLLRQ